MLQVEVCYEKTYKQNYVTQLLAKIGFPIGGSAIRKPKRIPHFIAVFDGTALLETHETHATRQVQLTGLGCAKSLAPLRRYWMQ